MNTDLFVYFETFEQLVKPKARGAESLNPETQNDFTEKKAKACLFNYRSHNIILQWMRYLILSFFTSAPHYYLLFLYGPATPTPIPQRNLSPSPTAMPKCLYCHMFMSWFLLFNA